MKSLPLFPPHALPLLQYGVPPMGYSPSWMFQCRSFPQNALTQEILNIGPSHRMQSFRNRLLQHESPTGCSYSAGLSLHTAALPRACSCMGSPWAAGNVHLLQCQALNGLQSRYLLKCGPPWAAREKLASPWSSPQDAGESPPVPSSLTLVSNCFFYHIFSLLALTAVAQRFFPFLNMFSPRCNQHHSLAQL